MKFIIIYLRCAGEGFVMQRVASAMHVTWNRIKSSVGSLCVLNLRIDLLWTLFIILTILLSDF